MDKNCNVYKIDASHLEQVFTKYLKDSNNYFVFSTDVVKNSWIDWCVLNPNLSGCSAVPLERFIAWDTFKREYIKENKDERTCIPAVLRKVFAQNLIQENAEKPFFQKIINPTFCKEANSFTKWLSKLLPNLKQWHTIRSKLDIKLDKEDSDYELLYTRYKDFLDKNALYEPSWQEINFTSQDKNFIIIFPEILEDFCDFEEVFYNKPNITLINLDTQITQDNGIPCYEYSDSRKELRRTILQIRELNKQGISYDKITLSVPDIETYRPYLERELKKYCIPFVIRSGINLLSGGEASIFKKFSECVNSDFNYNSVRSIVLDEYIPWKKELDILRENLIVIGCNKRTICNYIDNGKKIDTWELALNDNEHNHRELEFYRALKNDIMRICGSSSFRGIIQAWEQFKTNFLEESEFTTKANNIISRCIVHLQEIIQIEEDFFSQNNFIIKSPYDFFIKELEEKTYTMQSDSLGLNIYPYKLSAAAKFDYQFIIDASQNNLELPNKKLSFLSKDKRKLLGLIEHDKKYNPSRAFITLYAKSCKKELVTFSYAQNTFSGFAISHNLMTLVKDDKGDILKNPLEQLDKEDFILQETKNFLSKNINQDFKISFSQKAQFINWYNKNAHRFIKEDSQSPLSSNVLDKINFKLIENRNKHNTLDKTKLTITQTDMANFFDCPRKWLLNNVLNVQEESLETCLTKIFELGNLNHKILELYMKQFLESKTPLPILNDDNNLLETKEFLENLDKIIDMAILDIQSTYDYAPLVTIMFKAQKKTISSTICNFLQMFLETYGGYYVCGLEKSMSKEQNDYRLYGKIDSLLCSDKEEYINSEYCIIDYKNTGSSVPNLSDVVIKQKNEKDYLGDFQMAMYISLLKANSNKKIQAAYFYAICDETKKSFAIGKNNKTVRTEEDFDASLELFNRYTDDFNKSILENNFNVNDESFELSSFEDCASCQYACICRYSFTIANKDIKKGL